MYIQEVGLADVNWIEPAQYRDLLLVLLVPRDVYHRICHPVTMFQWTVFSRPVISDTDDRPGAHGQTKCFHVVAYHMLRHRIL